MDFLGGFLKSMVLLFIIMNPFASLPLFLSLTKGLSKKTVSQSADDAVIVAACLLYVFLFFGTGILLFFDVSFSSFQIAGGVVLLLMAIEIILGIKIIEAQAKKNHSAMVIIGTPLLTGPGVISTVVILSSEFGWPIVFAAGTAALFSAWLVLRNAERLQKALGEATIEAVSKMIGLLLAATAVELIRKGLADG